MATITTHVPSSPHHIRTALLAAVMAVVAVGMAGVLWATIDSSSSSSRVIPTVKSSDDVRVDFEADLRAERLAGTFSETVKSPDVVRAEFEADLREQLAATSAPIKTADEVRAEFEADLRAQAAATRAPVIVKSSDEVRAEFEVWLADKLEALDG